MRVRIPSIVLLNIAAVAFSVNAALSSSKQAFDFSHISHVLTLRYVQYLTVQIMYPHSDN